MDKEKLIAMPQPEWNDSVTHNLYNVEEVVERCANLEKYYNVLQCSYDALFDKFRQFQHSLIKISQMPDCGSYEQTIVRMKEIATNALKENK